MTNPVTFSYVIAEDEARIRKNLIKKIGAQDNRFKLIGEAFNGKEALQAISREKPDILFTDIRMPVMDGLRLIEEVYYHYPDIQTVIISGYEDFSYAKKAIQFDVIAYLLKPVDVEELSATLLKLAANLTDQFDQLEENTVTYSSHLAQETLARGVMEYLRHHYREDISIQTLAGHFHVNATYMTRILKKHIGKTPTKCIVDLRIQKAKDLMLSTDEMEFKEIAFAVGYTDQSYFSRIFKKTTGMSPSEYRDSRPGTSR